MTPPTGAGANPFFLGLSVLTFGATWRAAVETVRLADRLGYDGIFTADHLYANGGDPQQPLFEGWTTLAGWSQVTHTADLGLLVGANTFRNPGVVAKMAATLDHASGGRAILGLGAAWDEDEQRAHGIDVGRSQGQRLDWLDESLGLIRRVLAGALGACERPQREHVECGPVDREAGPEGEPAHRLQA